ncbi:MAG: sulfite exporter TauE/SafE family protein [Paracoccus sp. (in: a-proteobacteria)]|nr:sulfite exporter TauE/SafE family protein [Paracoccus sp. (in: a-proteobacteria)]
MIEGILVAVMAFGLGGVLKGAIGAGTPVVVIPLMSIYFGVPVAVATFAFPALASNLWQIWQYRAALADRGFVLRLSVAAALGAFVGTVLLATLPSEWLSVTVGLLALCYVAFRMMKPEWALSYAIARPLAAPAGFVAGVLQGAAGISAPVSVTYLHAVRLGRERFIATISTMFASMSVVQVPALFGMKVMDGQIFALSVLCCIPLFAAMPLGVMLVRRVGAQLFDRLIMAMLLVIAVRLILGAI